MGKDRRLGWRKGLWPVLLAVPLVALLIWVLQGKQHHVHRPATAAEELVAFSEGLKSSGPPLAALAAVMKTNAATALAGTLERQRDFLSAQPGGGGDLGAIGPVSCYSAGCMAEVHFKDRAAATAVEQRVLLDPSAPYREWPGTAFFGAFVDRPGRIVGAAPDVQGTDSVRAIEAAGDVVTVWGLLLRPEQHDRLLRLTVSRGDATKAPAPTSVVLNAQKENN